MRCSIALRERSAKRIQKFDRAAGQAGRHWDRLLSEIYSPSRRQFPRILRLLGLPVFAGGGLQPARSAKSLRARPNGEVLITDGHYLESKEHVGGFWLLNCGTEDEALAWGRKAAVACRAPVEVRPF